MGFSFLPQGEERKVTHVRIDAGVTRDFDEKLWERIKDYDRVKSLLSLGALAVTQEIDITAEHVVDNPTDENLNDVKLTDALVLIEASFDIDQLNKWNAKDQRIGVKNAIAKRITSITEGNG